jgi:hypothetical protein
VTQPIQSLGLRMMINEFNGLWRSGYNPELRQTFDETDTRPEVEDKISLATSTEQMKFSPQKMNFLQTRGHQKKKQRGRIRPPSSWNLWMEGKVVNRNVFIRRRIALGCNTLTKTWKWERNDDWQETAESILWGTNQNWWHFITSEPVLTALGLKPSLCAKKWMTELWY